MFLLGVIGFIVVVLLLMSSWQRRLDRREKQATLAKIHEAADRGTSKPLGQFPQINPYLCIGCGSCIEACPEDDVIGLVNGIAHIIHASRCVGHGLCELACPVNAIKVGLGNVALRPDIPVLSKDHETSLPGIYIAGELGGLSLIRNAMTTGAQAIEHLAQKIAASPTPPGLHDVVIVGAGPAGLAATLKSIERKLNYVTLSQDDPGGTVRKYPRRKLTLVQTMEIPLFGQMKGGEYEKEQIIQVWDQILTKYGVQVHTGITLQDVQRRGPAYEVVTNQGVIQTRFVVLAMGRRGSPRKLEVPGEDLDKVFYQLIDAATYSRQRLLVVGGGDSAVEAAIGLANQPGNTVTLSYRKEDFFRLKSRNEARIREYIAQKRIQVHFSSQVEAIEPTQVRLRVERTGQAQRVALPNDFVFVFAGGELPYPLMKKIGIRFGGESLAA